MLNRLRPMLAGYMRWASLALCCAALSACTPMPTKTQLDTPTFGALEVPVGNTWSTYSPVFPAAQVLPARGRGVKIWFYAPLGTFSASLRALDGTITPLSENRGAPAPAESGYFQMQAVNSSTSPPLHTMYVRAPLSLADPANYDVLITAKSLRSDVTDSNPLVVALRARQVFRVTVEVSGDGRVTSDPPGILCGRAPSGAVLNDCSYDFGPYPVKLMPGSGNNMRFGGWGGNCAPNVQTCELTLSGTAVSATASFINSNSPQLPAACMAAPLIPGLRWIDVPACATGNLDAHPGISNPALCDARGYFCCEPGPPGSIAPRCGGAGKIESLPDCRRHAPRGLLRQPGGCYEVDGAQ